MQEERSPRINSHVSRLNRFLPLSAAHDQIYEEYQTGEDGLDLATVALEYAERAVIAGAKCIVLTGDAGHGKTHLCRRLIESVLGYPGAEARRLLNTKCDGKAPIPGFGECALLSLRIHKDFSELDPNDAAALLEGVLASSGEPLIVCANEGRLRAVVSSTAAGQVCGEIVSLFESSFTTGRSSLDGTVHIINLNYQSIAANLEGVRESLVRRTLKSWASDRRRWSERGCGSCSLSEMCSIRRNRTLLVDEGLVSERRISRLEELCEAVERLGHVITIRQMLMLVSFLITGGLTCENVHRQVAAAHHKPGWQNAWAFYNVLFQPPPGVSEDQLYKGIPILSIFRRLDPGMIASRSVDEKILNIGGVFPTGELDLQFVIGPPGKLRQVDVAFGIDDFIGNPQSKAEQAREVEAAAKAVRTLRRRAFFDDEESKGTLMARLGFRSGDSFLAMLQGRLTPPEVVKLKNVIISGLHAIQGLRMSRTETTLHLVDPAFGTASADAAIIARRIPTNQLQMLPMQKAWTVSAGDWSVFDSVDWSDRSVVVRVQEPDGAHTDIALDLLSFECIARSAAGYVPEDFYSHEIRRVRAFLGRLASRGRSDSGEIALFMKGSVQNVSIDMGVIQVGGV